MSLPAPPLKEVLHGFESRTGLSGIEHEFRRRLDGDVLVIYLAQPTERFFRLLEDARTSATQSAEDSLKATLVKKSKPNLLQSAEGRLLLRTLSESLNINRSSFQGDFFARYTKSVFGAEEQVTAAANHVVFGRRGAGKSSLLLYALHMREQGKRPSVWIDMQVYAQRSDTGVIVDLLKELVLQARPHVVGDTSRALEALDALSRDAEPSEDRIITLLPDLRRLLSTFAVRGTDLAVFLDDFHVISVSLQPRLLGVLYAIARGNSIFLKLSAIETLTRTWDSQARKGLQIPHDVQEIKLDYNLTIPQKATEHIESILDAHATYCGLPSIRRLCTSPDVLSRLVWVAAGVPRDALNLFAQAMTKSGLGGSKSVSVSNVNIAASETVTTKLRDLETDAHGASIELHQTLDLIREFCINERKKNAFLVEIRTDEPLYQLVLKLVDLRLLHVINEGLSVGEAARKYLALILDYGFYIGIRAARSVDLFNRQTRKVAYKDLRRLPIFSG